MMTSPQLGKPILTTPLNLPAVADIAHPAYARALCMYLQAQGFGVDSWRAHLPARASTEIDPGRFLSLPEVFMWVQCGYALTHNPRLGWEVGLQSEVSSHGSVGFAALSAPNVDALLEMSVRFAPLRERLLLPSLVRVAGGARLTLAWADCLQHVPATHLLKVYIQAQFSAAFLRLLSAATGHALGAWLHLEWPLARSDWAEVFEGSLGQVQYGAQQWALFVPQAQLDLPCIGGDEAAYHALLHECEAALRRAQQGQLVGRIHALFVKDITQYQYLSAVAQALHMSERTLIRKLKEQGQSFTGLRDQYRLERANWYLHNTTLAMAQVAQELGFQDASNFSRAFRRLSGRKPSALRQSLE